MRRLDSFLTWTWVRLSNYSDYYCLLCVGGDFTIINYRKSCLLCYYQFHYWSKVPILSYCVQCPSVSISVHQCPSLISVHQCPSVSISVHQCPTVSNSVHQCPSVSISVHQCPSLISVHQCPSVSISVHQRPSVVANLVPVLQW